MARIDVYDTSGQKTGQAALPDKVFGAKINRPLMAQAVRVYLSNQRRATAKTKDRGEVTGSRRKIWRQKGTGRARHGDRYAPIFVGGGVAHGPDGTQNFKRRLPQKMKRAALFSALTNRFKDKAIMVVTGLGKIKPKTKQMAKIIGNLQLGNSTILLVLPEKMVNVTRAGRNLPSLKLISVDSLNTYQVLKPVKIVLMKEAISKIKEKWISNK